MLHLPCFFKYFCNIPMIYLTLLSGHSKSQFNENDPTEKTTTETLLPNPGLFESPPNNLARGRQYYRVDLSSQSFMYVNFNVNTIFLLKLAIYVIFYKTPLYDELKTKVKYSDCWAESLKILNSGCSKMCDDEQRRIAYQFTFCHMKASGRTLPPTCLLTQPIKTCTEKLPDLTFNVFTEFFTHVHDICFHLQQTYWQQQTEDTVQKLASSSLQLTRQLEESENLALKTLEYQKSVEGFTEKLVENELVQKTAFEDLREWIKSDVVLGLTSDIMSIHTRWFFEKKLKS